MNNSIIVGSLLGDAWVQKYLNRPNSYQISFSQSNVEYAEWKASLTEVPYYKYYFNKYDKRTEKCYSGCRITLKIKPKIKAAFYNLFYSPKKRVTSEILNQVDDLALTIWYLDDGNVYYNGNICHLTLAVNGFSEEEKTLIINWFSNKYNLNFKKSQKAIRLTSKKQIEIFMNIVESHIPPCMEYKKLQFQTKKYKNGKNMGLR